MAAKPSVLEQLEDLNARATKLNEELEEPRKWVEEYGRLMAQVETLCQKASEKYEKQLGTTRKLRESLETLKPAVGKAAGSPEGERVHDVAAAATAMTVAAEKTLESVNEMLPSTGSLFMRFFLGRVNVRLPLKRDKEKFRDEYNKFKSRTNIAFFIFPIVWAIISYYLIYHVKYLHWIPVITHVWLMYYYVTLALRENILKVNGSQIHPWWIYHHYISATMSVVVLTWGDTELYRSMMPMFTLYFLYQGFVQLFQSRYQQQRHYARIALGKAKDMDTTTSEGLQEFHAGLIILVTLLLVAYAVQAYMSFSLLRAAFFDLNLAQPWYEYREEVQAITCGVLFGVLCVGNTITLFNTLIRKTRRTAAPAVKPISAAAAAASSGASSGAGAEASAAAASAGGAEGLRQRPGK